MKCMLDNAAVKDVHVALDVYVEWNAVADVVVALYVGLSVVANVTIQ